jgi:Leucine-rich repeat (LRR) protein
LTKFDISDNTILAEGGKALAEALKGNQTITELSAAGNRLAQRVSFGSYDTDMSGVTALADAIPDMGAISSINLLKNNIPVAQAQELVKIMQAKENLATLCGLSREETELDFSGQYLNAGDAVLIANDISNMGALLSLSLKSNKLLTKEVGRALAQALANNSTLKELDVSSNNWMEHESFGKWMGDGPGFAQELAVGIKDNGALLSLDLSSNDIGAYYDGQQGKMIATPEGTLCPHTSTP